MGKGDKKSRRGKLFNGSFGKRRPRKNKDTVKTKLETVSKTTQEVKTTPAPKEKATPKKTAEKQKAANKAKE